MKKKAFITTLLIFCAVFELIGFGLRTESLAYYDWGPVSVTLGETAVEMKKNEIVTISAQVSPASDEQLPGCGMAQCPQQCGPDCINKQGDCQCAGTTYQTYYATVKISSSNTAIVNASYKAGVVSITGIAPGEAVIRVTGSLRQYSDSTKEIKVTVTEASSSSAAAAPSTTRNTSVPVSSDKNPGEAVTPAAGTSSEITPSAVSPSPTQSAPTEESGTPTGATQNTGEQKNGTVASQMGKYIQIELKDDETVSRDAFAEIQGQDINKTFKKTDNNGNVLYSWTFNGLDITAPAAIDLTILNTAASEGKIEKLVKQNSSAKIFSFAYSGPLPGRAEIYIRVSDIYQNGQMLDLLRYNSETKLLEPVTDKIKVENGYAMFKLDHCSDYVLIPENESHWIVPATIVIAIIAVFAAFILIARYKKRGKACDDEDNT